jgi:hypothetical protein
MVCKVLSFFMEICYAMWICTCRRTVFRQHSQMCVPYHTPSSTAVWHSIYGEVCWQSELVRWILSFLYCAPFQHMKSKTNRCHYFNFIHILMDLYMFRAYRSILRRAHTAVHTTIGSDTEPMVVWTLLRMDL